MNVTPSNITILILGATGFLGSHIAKVLLDKGYNIVILKRFNSSLHRFTKEQIDKLIFYDVEKTILSTIFKKYKINLIINSATNYGRKGESLDNVCKTNILFPLSVLEIAIDNKCETFINIDTLLPANLNPYTISKKSFVEWGKYFSNQIQFINLAVEHMYGVGDDDTKFIDWVTSKLISSDTEINLTSGIQKRDFIHVSDVVSAIITCINERKNIPNFITYDIATGNQIQVKDLILMIVKILQEKYDVKSIPKLNFGKIPYRNGEAMSVKENIDPIKSLGWFPKITLEQGIKEKIEEIWFKGR